MTPTDQHSEVARTRRFDPSLLRDRFTLVWALLVAATAVTFWVGTDHGLSSGTARTLLILAIAFIKVRFIGLYFMELRAAPLLLRALFETYCVFVCLAMAGVYLVA